MFLLNVTAKDIKAGHVRVTREPKRDLGFPREPATVDIEIRGHTIRAFWDPRVGPDQERSGLLRVGRDIANNLLGAPRTFTIRRSGDGMFVLD